MDVIVYGHWPPPPEIAHAVTRSVSTEEQLVEAVRESQAAYIVIVILTLEHEAAALHAVRYARANYQIVLARGGSSLRLIVGPGRYRPFELPSR